MKLLFCPDCGDAVKLLATFRRCRCGAVEGRYVDDERVEISGERGEVLGLDGHTLKAALALVDTNDRYGPGIEAWMFQHGAEQVTRLGRRR